MAVGGFNNCMYMYMAQHGCWMHVQSVDCVYSYCSQYFRGPRV